VQLEDFLLLLIESLTVVLRLLLFVVVVVALRFLYLFYVSKLLMMLDEHNHHVLLFLHHHYYHYLNSRLEIELVVVFLREKFRYLKEVTKIQKLLFPGDPFLFFTPPSIAVAAPLAESGEVDD
jgi:hypothetical protein